MASNAEKTQKQIDKSNDERLKKDAEANIMAIKLTLMNSKGEEHCCELSDASDEIKDSILDLIVKLRKQNDVQIKFVQGFEVKVTPNLIKGIHIELK